MNPEWVGYAAAILTTAAYVPQTIKVFRFKETSALSLGTYVTLAMGVGGWFLYGILLDDWPLISANGLSLVMIFAILGMKLKHG